MDTDPGNLNKASEEVDRYLATTLGTVNAGRPEVGVDVISRETSPGTGVLTSFWYYRKFDFARIPEGVPLILDSGAFSAYTSGAEIALDDYADWCEALSGRYRFAFNLDVIGDPQGSFEQWLDLQERRGLRTVPVIHYGDRPEEVLPRYIDAGADRLALGGIALGMTPQVMSWIAYVFRYLREHDLAVPVHGLGIHMRSKAARFPWATTDSSAFTGAWRFARLALWMPDRRRWVTVPLDGRMVYRYGNVIRFYGFEPEQVAVSNSSTREALVRLATRVECQAAADWNGRKTSRYTTTKPSVVTGVGLDVVAEETQRFLAETAERDLAHELEELS